MIEQNFIQLYEDSFQNNWELPALTDYKEKSSFTYGEVATQIAKLHNLFEEANIQRGDKIALIGKNHSSWCTVFLASITYGAVIVPILHDFHPDNMLNIILHSDAKLMFVDENLYNRLDKKELNVSAVSIPSFRLIDDKNNLSNVFSGWEQLFEKKYPKGFNKEDVKYPTIANNEVICINYTSGTTGFSKGVMLTANNYAGNVLYAQKLDLLFNKDVDLAFLPMAHAYGCAFDFLYALSAGVHVYLLGAMPTPHVLVNAFQEIKPNLIISVPLIFEKIYKKKILPIIENPVMKILLKLPITNAIFRNRIRKSLIKSLGGNFREVIIGGAALSAEVEDFFKSIRFPFTVGYGMTECGPLISYENNRKFKPHSCGKVLEGFMEARIDSPDPRNIPGEIQVRGENVMKGYYKNPEATAAAFTEDGWLKTGDTGVMDSENHLYIKGRLKTMILSSNGQNIYPEEIEARLNNLPYVAESLVISREGKIIGLVYPDKDAISANKVDADNLPQIMEENKQKLNKHLSNYEKLAQIEIMDKEFEKTPKKSIKRFIYQQ